MNLLISILLIGRLFFVVQQPLVSTQENVLTQWREASPYGSTALLAHLELAGQYFDDLKIEDLVTLIFKDGKRLPYQVTQIVRVGELFDNDSTFRRVYVGNHLVLQTCTEDGGRLFVIAFPFHRGLR